MRIRTALALSTLAGLVSSLLAGCGPAASEASRPTPTAEEPVELASLMGELQRHTAKLGYALAGKNLPLAQFYLEEIGEVTTKLVAIDTHDGMPIGPPTQIILNPALGELSQHLAAGELAAASSTYGTLVAACNRCHAATEHGFIVITQATGTPPFNQDFSG